MSTRLMGTLRYRVHGYTEEEIEVLVIGHARADDATLEYTFGPTVLLLYIDNLSARQIIVRQESYP